MTMIAKYFKGFSLLMVMIGFGFHSRGQSSIMDFLGKLKQINNGKHIAYQYQVLYINEENKVSDSVAGRLYKDGSSFVDENNLMLSACTNGYYCKVEKEKRNVHVYAAGLFQKYLGINVTEESSMLVIPDSIIFKHGSVRIDTLKNGNYSVNINIGLDVFDKAVFEINKKTYLLESGKIEMFENVMAANMTFRKVYIINDIRYNFNKNVFNLKHIYNVKNGVVSLNKKYRNYNLKTLTN